MQAPQLTSKTLQALACALALSSAAQAAPGDTALDRVEVQGSGLRTDVLRNCPAVQADLQEALARAQYRHQIEGSYRISFELGSQGVIAVDSGSAPREYRQPIRLGLRQTACQQVSSEQAPQRFAFMLDVRNDASDSRLAGSSGGLMVGIRELP